MADTLAISRGRVGFVIQQNLDMREFSAKWDLKYIDAVRFVFEFLLQKPFWTDFGGISWDA
jgi:hypothetical protein